jgi:glycosyltransferase involved in cell wall biosynthesis
LSQDLLTKDSLESIGGALARFVHVPTPGDHYSPSTGSAVMTVIHEISREHGASGGETVVVLDEQSRFDYTVGERLPVAFRGPLTPVEKALDVALGISRAGRRFAHELYLPAADLLGPDESGTLFIHNSPSVIDLFRRKCPRARIVLYCHNDLFRTYSRNEIRRTVAMADHVICVSDFLADGLRRELHERDHHKVTGVINGVNTQVFRPYAPEEVAAPIILFVGRVVPQKGPHLLVSAAEQLLKLGHRFRLRIVGSSGFCSSSGLTPYERELRRLAGPLGDSVEFQAFVDRHQVVEEYRAASVFCVPSTWDEPCSLTASEGMACGLPTIASRRGGLPEVGGEAVLYFSPPDTGELTQHLTHLLQSAAVRNEWGARARARAEELDWSTRYAQIQQALDR